MTKPNSSEIVFVLDRSGSMESIRMDMIGGFAEVIRQQRAVPGECRVTLVQFDTQYEIVYAGVPLATVPPLDLQPRGGTALLDAIGRAIQTTGQRLAAMHESERPSKVIFVILTDGHENSSQEFTFDLVADLIKQQREVYHWDFVFLGADMNAIAVAGRLNIGNAAHYRASTLGVRAASASVGRAVGLARASGQSVNYNQKMYDKALKDEEES